MDKGANNQVAATASTALQAIDGSERPPEPAVSVIECRAFYGTLSSDLLLHVEAGSSCTADVIRRPVA